MMGAAETAGSEQPTSQLQQLSVGEDSHGVRIDQWLLGHFPSESRSSLKRWIEEHRVTVDGRPAKPSTHLRNGQQVQVAVPPPPAPAPIAEDIPLTILHADDYLLVIDKPADMVVHPSTGARDGGTLVNALLGQSGTLSREGGEHRPGIVHRLDRHTSGLLLVARTDQAHRYLADQFKQRTIEKQYLACAHGHPGSEEGEVEAPIGRSPTHRKRMTIRHDDGGKPALTRWRVEKRHEHPFTWFRLFPHTGRTHQIRVHLKSIGHPIICDATYGREKQLTRSELQERTPKAGEQPIIVRHALHAAALRFRHPRNDQWQEFESPLPPDMQRVWDGG